MRKTIVTAAGPHMVPVLDGISLPSFTAFAKQHGYGIHVSYLKEDYADRWNEAAKHVRWQKLGLIRAALEQSDVVVWFDADVFVCRTDTDILDSLGKTHYQGFALHTIPSENRTNPNTGVWVLRNTLKTFRFLDRVVEIGMPEGRWADQGAVFRALEWVLGDDFYRGARIPDAPTEFIDGTAWLPDGWNQPYMERHAGPMATTNPFAIHFMGMSIPERLKSMREVADWYSNRGCKEEKADVSSIIPAARAWFQGSQ